MRTNAANDKYIELCGVVTEALPGGIFIVMVEGMEHSVLCYLSGRVRQFGIVITVGDGVLIRTTPQDLSKGRICYRL